MSGYFLAAQTYQIVYGDANHDMYDTASRIFGNSIVDNLDRADCVLFTRRNDSEADMIGLQLTKRGLTYVRVNADDLSDTVLSYDLGGDPLSVAGRWCQSSDTPLLIFRHFDLTAISKGDNLADEFLRIEWEAVLDCLGSVTKSLNAPSRVRTLDSLTQLRLAREVGFTVPASIISNDASRIQRFCSSAPDGIIIKSLGAHFMEHSPNVLNALFPRRVKAEDMAVLDFSQQPPLLYQEWVRSDGELRVYVIGRTVIAYDVKKDTAEDLWTRPDSVVVRQCNISRDLAHMCLDFMLRARLEYGALDILLNTSTSSPIATFLEVNPAGDWRYFEERAGSRAVTDAFCDLIAAERQQIDGLDHGAF